MAATKLTDKLTNIADAIREKTGESGALTLDGMAAAIGGISAGGGGTYPSAAGVKFPVFFDNPFPPLPEGVEENRPYYVIRKTDSSGYYDLVFSDGPWYYRSSTKGLAESGSDSKPWYRVKIAEIENGLASGWSFYQDLDEETALGIDSSRYFIYSSHDVYVDSVGAGEIYLEGSGPFSKTTAYTTSAEGISLVAKALKEWTGGPLAFPDEFVSAAEEAVSAAKKSLKVEYVTFTPSEDIYEYEVTLSEKIDTVVFNLLMPNVDASSATDIFSNNSAGIYVGYNVEGLHSRLISISQTDNSRNGVAFNGSYLSLNRHYFMSATSSPLTYRNGRVFLGEGMSNASFKFNAGVEYLYVVMGY